MKITLPQITPGDWHRNGQAVFALQDNPRIGWKNAPLRINRFYAYVQRDNPATTLATVEEIEANTKAFAAVPKLLQALAGLSDYVDLLIQGKVKMPTTSDGLPEFTAAVEALTAAGATIEP